MTWTALIYVLVIFVIIISVLVAWAWPRTPDGKLMHPDQVEDFMKKFPRPPTDWAVTVFIMLFALLAMIGVALSAHDPDGDSHRDD